MDELKELEDLAVLRASWALFVSDERFAQENHEHLARGRKRAELMMRLPAEGRRPHQSTREGERLYSDESRALLLSGLLSSLMLTGLALACALVGAFVLGAVGVGLPVNPGKLLQAIGGALALWGTLFAFRGPQTTWGGGSVPERVHAFLYTCLLSLGGGAALLGTLL